MMSIRDYWNYFQQPWFHEWIMDYFDKIYYMRLLDLTLMEAAFTMLSVSYLIRLLTYIMVKIIAKNKQNSASS